MRLGNGNVERLRIASIAAAISRATIVLQLDRDDGRAVSIGSRREGELARLIDEGRLSEDQANTHPQSNLLTGCLGTQQDPPVELNHIDYLEVGDSLMACSDGLWHYLTAREIGAIINALSPREATEMLISKARQRARGSGDNLSLVLVRVEAIS